MKAIWLCFIVLAHICFVGFHAISEAKIFECFPIDDSSDTRRYSRFLGGEDENVPRTVQLIYFAPNDTTFRDEIVTRLKEQIQIIQGFYAEQMAARGHLRTFWIETDGRGSPKVHKVVGNIQNNTIETMVCFALCAMN